MQNPPTIFNSYLGGSLLFVIFVNRSIFSNISADRSKNSCSNDITVLSPELVSPLSTGGKKRFCFSNAYNLCICIASHQKKIRIRRRPVPGESRLSFLDPKSVSVRFDCKIIVSRVGGPVSSVAPPFAPNRHPSDPFQGRPRSESSEFHSRKRLLRALSLHAPNFLMTFSILR